MAAAERLVGAGFRRLLASPYRRTLETASRIADRLGLDIEVEPLVRERCAFSCDQGSPASVLARDWPMLDFGGLEEIWWGWRIESQASLEARAGVFCGAWPNRTISP
ncbi:MAG: histidine phosphatase family protein [Geminicoccaceae bacterium]